MIRQFLATTVENLRSFISSLSRPASSGSSSSNSGSSGSDSLSSESARRELPPDSAMQRRRLHAAGISPPRLEGPTEQPTEQPTEHPTDIPAPSLPDATQSPAAQAPATQPADRSPGAEENPTTEKSADGTTTDETAGEETGPAPVSSPIPEKALENAPAHTPAGDVAHEAQPDAEQPREDDAREGLQHGNAPASEPAPPIAARPLVARRRAPHLFPTQSVPAQPSVPTEEIPAKEIPTEEIDERPSEKPAFPAPEPDTESEADPESQSESESESLPGFPVRNGTHPPDAPPYTELLTVLESLLFVAGEPVGLAQLARALEMEQEAVAAALDTLAQTYTRQNRGLRIQAHRDKYQIVTAPAAAPHIERFLNLDTSSKLSGPALETLAVVAYRQPVTRSQVEAVRGVDCAAVLRSLAQRGLIEEVGRLDVVGRPILYGVTNSFMQHFGLTDLDELPPLEQTEADTLWAATALAELEGQPEGEHMQDEQTQGEHAQGEQTQNDSQSGPAPAPPNL